MTTRYPSRLLMASYKCHIGEFSCETMHSINTGVATINFRRHEHFQVWAILDCFEAAFF